MRRVGITIVVLAALLALAIVFWPEALSGRSSDAERTGAGSDGPSALATEAGKPAPGSLASAGSNARDRALASLERALRGRSSIAGVVRIGSKPVAATVELFFSRGSSPSAQE